MLNGEDGDRDGRRGMGTITSYVCMSACAGVPCTGLRRVCVSLPIRERP